MAEVVMSLCVHIRPSRVDDLPAIERLYVEAIPRENLVPLIRALSVLEADVLSLVALHDTSLAAHVCFTIGNLEGCELRPALLGPLAVAPALQRRGIGARLVREGLRRLTHDGVACVCVLGNPGYYGRLGFATETQIRPPCPLVAQWEPAWQSVRPSAGAAPCRGRLLLPEPWLRPELWAP